MGIEREKGRLTLGSLFDGSGGFPLAAEMCGITPVWASEIDPFCVQVTSKRFPNMKHLGDITKINGAEIPPVNTITFGSPCQDLSVAGNRAGLDGSRSSLFLEAIRIFKEMRETTNGIYPNIVVWENVPGAYSSHKGEDFRRVLEEIAGVADATVSIPRPAGGAWNSCGCIMGDGYSIAWRTLDAEYWGVPQRRKRIFLVADFGGGRAPEILFKRNGLQRGFKACGKTRERASAPVESGAGVSDSAEGFKAGAGAKAGNIGYSAGISPTLQAEQETHCLCYAIGNGQADNTGLHKTVGALNCMHDREAVIYDCRGNGDGATCPTITGDHNNRVTDYTAICIAGNAIDRKIKNGGNGKGVSQDVAYTLNTVDRHVVMAEQIYSLDRAAFNQGENAKYDFSVQENMAQAVVARGSGAIANIGKMIVRRLMPVEEARLQGFPDWWCADIPHKDTPEYRMWGNGVALPCVLYVIEGILEILNNGSDENGS